MPKNLFLQIIAALLILSGCNLLKTRDNKRKALRIIDRESVLFDRLDTGEAGRLAFKTSELAFCSLKYWSLEEGTNPAADKVKSQPCSNTQAQNSFVELIKNLRMDTLYMIEIAAWPVQLNEQNADRHRIKENGDEGIGRDLVVVRLNTPLHVAEIHRHRSGSRLELQELREVLRPEPTCTKGTNPAVFEKQGLNANAELNLTEIKSMGYGISSASEVKEVANVQRALFNVFQRNDPWQWLYQENGISQVLLVSQGAELFELSLSGKTSQTLFNRIPTRASESVQISDAEDLSITWTADHLNDYSNIFLQVGAGTSGDQGFHCFFKAQDGSAQVKSSDPLLKSLTKGSYDTIVGVMSNNLQIFPGQKRTPWLLSNFDWRIGKIEKL